MRRDVNDGAGPGRDNISYYEALACVYDLFFQDIDETSETEVAWLLDLLSGRGHSTVLDAGCGNGRHAARLARAGYEVVGADPSSAMLARAASTAERFGVRLPLLKATFDQLPSVIPHSFDVVLSFGNSLCNLGSQLEIKQALAALHSCCLPTGICLVGIKEFDRIKQERPQFQGHRMVDRDGIRTILFETWEYVDPVLACTAYLVQGAVDSNEWRTSSAATREYMLVIEEMQELAIRAGFESALRIDHPSEAAYLLRA